MVRLDRGNKNPVNGVLFIVNSIKYSTYERYRVAHEFYNQSCNSTGSFGRRLPTKSCFCTIAIVLLPSVTHLITNATLSLEKALFRDSESL